MFDIVSKAVYTAFALCKKLRKTTDTPILFISARQSDEDILLALNIGGDDYIRKPYSLSVLLAKVKVFLKRFSVEEQEVYNTGDLYIEYSSHKVMFKKQEVILKAMEYKLLCYLIKNKGRVVTKEEIFENVWEDAVTSDGTLNVHIRHLREKIEENPNAPIKIKTIWGVGYQFGDS